MKKLIMTSLVVLSTTLTGSLFAADTCLEQVNEHIGIVTETENYFAAVTKHSSQITAFEITQVQKKLTQRYLSLKALIKLYEAPNSECQPKVLATSVAIYDFSAIGQTLIANTDMRRVVKGFTKYKEFQLGDFLSSYEHYTSKAVIAKAQAEMNSEKGLIPAGLNLANADEKDPKVNPLSDKSIKGATSAIAGAALAWGYISDHLKWRQGHLKDDKKAKELVLSKLRPLDLIFETRKFTLTNYTIPGNWGHVAIWLGTKEELIALNIWDQPFFENFKKFVEEGKNIVEIRKTGLNFQSLDSFINLDEIAVTRIEGVLDRASTVYSELTFQAGKKYDFKFDARTADKITCAEFIAFSYGDIKWPETKTLFQVSLSPDDIGVLTLDPTSPATFVLYLVGNKKGQEFSNLGFEDWKKVFKNNKYLTPKEREQLEIQKAKIEKEKAEKAADDLLNKTFYAG